MLTQAVFKNIVGPGGTALYIHMLRRLKFKAHLWHEFLAREDNLAKFCLKLKMEKRRLGIRLSGRWLA